MTRIVELRAHNFARLSAVSIRPDGSLVQITGKNSQGKTSVLRAIWTACEGRAVAPAQPIRKGADEARLQLDIGTMLITRTFRRGKGEGEIIHDLKVTMADGSRAGAKPQAMIDALLGDLSFNPLEFSKLKPDEQFERVKQLVPGFDFAANAAARTQAFKDRTEANRVGKDSRARAAGVRLPPGPKPKAVSTETLAAKLSAATASNRQNADTRAERQRQVDAANDDLDEAERLRARAADLERNANAKLEQLAKLPPIPDDIDTGAITAQIAAGDTVRAAIAAHESRDGFERAADEAEQLAEQLTQRIEELDGERHQAITSAKMPVEGLEFGDNEVLLNTLPFSQAGTAEKIRASVGIAMALNPDLRIMLIDEGSELDSESLAMVAALATEHDYQVWVARVAEGEAARAGFEIVDGALAVE